MAAIDKTYVRSWEEWNSIMEWVRAHDTEVDPNHTMLSEYLPFYYELDDDCDIVEGSERDFTKEEVEGKLQRVYDKNIAYGDTAEEAKEHTEIYFWNTPWEVDYFLIRHCDLPVIVNRLHEQYGNDEYYRIKNMSEKAYNDELNLIHTMMI